MRILKIIIGTIAVLALCTLIAAATAYNAANVPRLSKSPTTLEQYATVRALMDQWGQE